LIGAACVAATSAVVSIPGIFSAITEPGLKPSPVLYGATSMCWLLRFVGVASSLKSMRRPVGLVGSTFV